MANALSDKWMSGIVKKLGGLPVNYAVFDIESTGLDMNNDVPVQLGYALVIDKVLIDCSYYVADWTHGKSPDFCDWLDARMQVTKKNMESKVGVGSYRHSIERMKTSGVPACDAFTEFSDVIDFCKSYNFSFVAHNGLKFDQPMLDRCAKELRGESSGFNVGEKYFDTMAMERGCQSMIAPSESDNWFSFTKRMISEGGRFYSSLSGHCDKKYNLTDRYNLKGSAHEADFDCRLTHHLFEEYRAMAERHAAQGVN